MDKKVFFDGLNSPKQINADFVAALESITEKYPYFQSAKALYIKGLKQNNSFKYNNQLKKTAAHTIDRAILFDFISDFAFSQSKAQSKKVVSKKQVATKQTFSEDLEIGTPLEFDKNETHSFHQWLQLSSKKTINRNEISEKNIDKNSDLIDKFIEVNPTIKPISKESSHTVSNENYYNEEELMTETLAKVYLEQKKYTNAINAYKILILKYPEKSGFFADQIKKIEYLKNK